jgi:hypothetical protein
MASSQCLSESSGLGIGIVVEVELLQPELESGLGEDRFYCTAFTTETQTEQAASLTFSVPPW